MLTYGVTQAIGGSGFLAVYVSGIVLGNENYLHKRSLRVFHDGLAWLMQIVMFLTMGLLVLPSELSRMAVSGIVLSGFLVLVARPVSVLLCLTPFRFSWRDQLMVSWAGLRGAVPIVVATYPLIAGASSAQRLFDLVFFVVFISVLLQGTTIPAGVEVAERRGADREDLSVSDRVQPDDGFEERARGSPRAAAIGGDRPVADRARPACGGVDCPDPPRRRRPGPARQTQIESGDTLLALAEPDALGRIRGIVGEIVAG